MKKVFIVFMVVFGVFTGVARGVSEPSITYIMDGGTNYANAPTGYTEGTGTTIDGIPTKSGYTFAGWCTDSGLTDCAMSQTIGTDATGDKTFYAKWTACTACAATNASCELSVVSNVCTYTTSCNTGYSNIQNNGAYNASCSPGCDSVIGNTAGTDYAAIDYNGTTQQGTPSTYGLTGNQVFATSYGDLGYVTGRSICSTQGGISSGNATTASEISTATSLSAGGANCWCKLTGYKPVGGTLQTLNAEYWTFQSVAADGSGQCLLMCSRRCGSNMMANDSTINLNFRSVMSDAVVSNSVFCPIAGPSITYVMDGGTNYAGAPTRYVEGTGTTIDGTPTKSGYTFAGWCTDAELQNCAMSQTIDTNATGDKTFYAKWTACTACAATNASCELSVVNNVCTYTTSCNTGYGNIQNNGAYNASCTASSQYTVTYACGTGATGNPPTSETVAAGASFTPSANNTCAKTGYTFDGWNDGTTDRPAGTAYTYGYNDDITLTAKWAANIYNITLENVSQVPSAYTELEYLESTGTQYINTGYYANQNTKIFVDFQLTSTRGGQYMFGRWASNGSGKLCFGIYTSGSASDNSSTFAECSYNANSCSHWSNNAADLDRHQITLSARNHVEDSSGLTFPSTMNRSSANCGYNTVVASLSSTYTAAGAFTIFGNASANCSAMKLYNTKIWDNDVLSHNYVPVKRNSDNVLGLYDTVTNTFLTNAGTGTFDAGNSASGSTSTYTYGVGATIDDVPTRDGYTFAGWCTDAQLQNCAMTQTVANDAIGDKTFYAKWTASSSYTVTYACGTGATGNPPTSETVAAGASFTPSANNTCAKTGYTFDGWNDGTTDRPAGTAYTYSYGDDITLTAKWTVNTYIVTYTMNDGTNYNGAPSTYTYGVGAIIDGMPTKSGYTFAGWTGSNGNTPQLTVAIGTGDSGDKTYTANWTACTACAATNASCTFDGVVNNVCTYTTSCNTGYGNIQNNGAYNASCSANTYNITYIMNEGTNYANAPANYTYGTGVTIDGVPTRSGYIFVGWCADAQLQNCAMTQTVANDAIGDKTFYAKWMSGVACSVGYYLSANSSECSICPGDSYCPGGNYAFSGSVNQGVNACPAGYNYNTTAGKTSINQCQIHCDGGTYVGTANGSCVNVGTDYYAAGAAVGYGSTSTRNACPTGLRTVGYGHGADSANDCGRTLHLGDYTLQMRRDKETTPSINVETVNGDRFYISLSPTNHNLSRLHIEYNGQQYTAYDDSLFYGERNFETGLPTGQ